MTKRAAIYCRISEDPRDTERGVTRQREDCEALVKARGWTLSNVFSDNDISAFKGARRKQGYEPLMDSAKRGEVDVIVAYGLSRLWRSRTERAQAMEVLSKAQVNVCLVKGSDIDLTSAAGRAVAGILGEMDTMDSELKAERVARAAQQRAEEGRPNAGLGYGWTRVYERNEAGKVLSSRDEVNEAQAEVVRHIVNELLEAESIKSVAAGLTERGVPRPTGQAAVWGPSTVRKLAIRPSNAAIRIHRGAVIGVGNWPPLVKRDDHDRVVALLNNPKRRLSRDGSRKHLLSYGIGKCGVCGSVLRVQTRGGNLLYVCNALTGCVGRRVAWVDDLVTGLVTARLAQPGARDLLARDDTAGDEARERAMALRARMDSAADTFAAGAIDAEQLTRITAHLRPQLAAAEAEAARAVEGVAPSLIDAVVSEQAATAWEGLDVTQRRAMLAALGISVVILPARGGPGFRPEFVRVEWDGQAQPPQHAAEPQ